MRTRAFVLFVAGVAGGCDDGYQGPDWGPSVSELRVSGGYGAMEVQLAFTVTDEEGSPLTCTISTGDDGPIRLTLPCAGDMVVPLAFPDAGFYDVTVRAMQAYGSRDSDSDLRVRVPFGPPITGFELAYEHATLLSTVTTTAWSPDGTRVVTGDAQGIRMWDPTDGSRLARWETGPVADAAWSGDGARLAVLLETGTLAIHDGDTGAILTELGQGTAFAWSPDGTRVVLGDLSGTLRILDAATGELVANLTGHFTGIAAAAWSPDGDRIATADREELRLWRGDTNGLYAEIARQPSFAIADLAWAPDSRTVAAARATVIDTWSREGVAGAAILQDQAVAIAYSPDGAKLAAAGAGDDVVVHELGTGVATTLVGHTAQADAVAWSPDSTRLASGGFDASMRVWDPAAAAAVTTVLRLAPVRAVAWSADGATLAVREGASSITVRDAQGFVLETLDGDDYADLLSFRPDGTQLAASTTGGDVAIADVDSGVVVRRIPTDPEALAWGDDWLAISDDAGRVLAWNADTGQLGRTLTPYGGEAYALAWRHDGVLATLTRFEVAEWDVDAGVGDPMHTVNDALALAYSPSDELLAIGHANRVQVTSDAFWTDVYTYGTASTVVWDALAGRVAIGDGPEAISPGSISIYDVANGERAASIPVAEVAVWSPDGEHIAVGSVAGRFAIYRVLYEE